MKYSREISIALVLMVLLMQQLFAQPAKSSQQQRFHSYNSLQVLKGQSSVSASLHSVNGLQWGKLFAGAGTGFDFYYHTSVPFFLETRYQLFEKKNSIQVFADAGIHIPLGNTNVQNPGKTGDFKTGRLLAGGIDYLIPLKKDVVMIGVAYSQKTITQMVNHNGWNPVLNRNDNIPVKELYQFNRVWFKVGFVF